MQKNRNKKEVFSAGYLYHTNFGTFEVFRQISRIYYGSLEIYYGIESNGEYFQDHAYTRSVWKLPKFVSSTILYDQSASTASEPTGRV